LKDDCLFELGLGVIFVERSFPFGVIFPKRWDSSVFMIFLLFEMTVFGRSLVLFSFFFFLSTIILAGGTVALITFFSSFFGAVLLL